jgi:hypothetical protein
VRDLAPRLAAIPGVVAVTLGGSQSTGTAGPDSDWDFGLYYRNTIDPADVRALGFDGQVFAPGDWGRLVNGGAWLTVEGVGVDLVYRDLDEVLHWTAAADEGRFEIQREVGYVAGIPTYLLAGELALGEVLHGALPRPEFTDALRASAPPLWNQLAAGALHVATVHASRGDRVAALANATQAVLACSHARLAERGEWILNEKQLVARAGLTEAADLLDDLEALRAHLALPAWK